MFCCRKQSVSANREVHGNYWWFSLERFDDSVLDLATVGSTSASVGLRHTRSSRDSLVSLVNAAVCSAPWLLVFVHTLQIGVVGSTATVAPLAVPPNDALRLPGLCKLD